MKMKMSINLFIICSVLTSCTTNLYEIHNHYPVDSDIVDNGSGYIDSRDSTHDYEDHFRRSSGCSDVAGHGYQHSVFCALKAGYTQ